MTAHIEMPALDPAPNTPTTLSRADRDRACCGSEMGFDGLIYTDSMGMAGVTALYKPGEAAVRAIKAGNDIVLHSPDDGGGVRGDQGGGRVGRDSRRRSSTKSVERILRAKARAGLHRTRAVNLDALPNIVGGRAHQAVARRGEPEVDHAGEGRSATRCR